MKFYPYKNGGPKKFSHAEGGHQKKEVVLTQELEVLAMVMWGGGKRFPPYGGAKKVSEL